VRREHEQALLRGYHDRLIARGVTGYAYDELIHDYRRGLLIGFTYVVQSGAASDPENSPRLPLFESAVRRLDAAVHGDGVLAVRREHVVLGAQGECRAGLCRLLPVAGHPQAELAGALEVVAGVVEPTGEHHAAVHRQQGLVGDRPRGGGELGVLVGLHEPTLGVEEPDGGRRGSRGAE
jgi:hypothetical protein